MDNLLCLEILDRRLASLNPTRRRIARNANASAVEWVGNGTLDSCFLGCAVYALEQSNYVGQLDSPSLANWLYWIGCPGGNDDAFGIREVGIMLHRLYAPGSAGLFICGAIAAIGSLSGYFNSRLAYCDAATNPCTRVAISVDVAPPKTAQDAIVLPGNGKMRLSLGLVAIALLAGGYAVSALEIEGLSAKARQEELDAELEEKRQVIVADEEEKKLVLAADIRFQEFEQQLLDGYAMLLLENNPELAEQILAEKPPAQIQSENVTATATIDAAAAPVDSFSSSSADDSPAVVVDSSALGSLVAAGGRAIDGLIETSQSLIFLGTPGAGKSVSLGIVLGRKKKRFGDRVQLLLGRKRLTRVPSKTTFEYAENWRLTCRRGLRLMPFCTCNPMHGRAVVVHHVKYKRSPIRRLLGLLLFHSPRRTVSGREIIGYDAFPLCENCHHNNYAPGERYLGGKSLATMRFRSVKTAIITTTDGAIAKRAFITPRYGSNWEGWTTTMFRRWLGV
jgi:hypothetical protein